MSSIPFMVFNTPEIHQHIRRERSKNNGGQKTYQGQKRFKTQDMGEPSTKSQFNGEMYNYNLKFMNSVWGLYNRYAPQAFQKNEEYYHK